MRKKIIDILNLKVFKLDKKIEIKKYFEMMFRKQRVSFRKVPSF